MRRFVVLSCAILAACFDSRRVAERDCGAFGELCPAPVDSGLVESIASTWLLEIDPIVKESGPVVIGRGGDSAWTIAVYQRLRAYRPDYFVLPADSAHAPHLTGIEVEMVGDTAHVTTSISECMTRQSTYNWREHGLAHRFIPYAGQWTLLPGSLAHLANGKC
jgi:hypothetical protein